MEGGGVVNATPRPHFPPKRDTVSIMKKAGWAPGPLCMIAENLISTGIWSPDRAARNESLYQLSYPGRIYTHRVHWCVVITYPFMKMLFSYKF
jgi:hypothetical protein